VVPFRRVIIRLTNVNPTECKGEGEREGVIVNSCKEDQNLPLNTPSLAQWKKRDIELRHRHSYGSVEIRGSRGPSFNYSKHAWPVPFFANFYVHISVPSSQDLHLRMELHLFSQACWFERLKLPAWSGN